MRATDTVVQLRLRSGTTQLTTWVPVQSGLAAGNRLTLRGDDVDGRLWEIVAVSAPHRNSEINRGWNNNI